jgi:HK97 family phage major capsid protein
MTYERNSPNSFVGDLVRLALYGLPEAEERLKRHRKELAVEAERRVQRGQLEYRDLTRVSGSVQEFAPPIWLLDDFAAAVNPFRMISNLIGSRPLPPGVQAVSLPRVTTGALTGIQTADTGVVAKRDVVTATASAPVRTIAGQVDMALQVLEQGPNADEHILLELASDYAAQLETQVINGSGAAGQVTGLLNTSGIDSTATYVDASPTVPELYLKLAKAANQVHANRRRSAQAFVLHPRRWNWILSALDTSNRPLVVPNAGYAPFAPVAADIQAGSASIAGNALGLPVFLSDSVPTTLGAGTEDAIIAFRPVDARLWESVPRTRVMPTEPLSGTLEARVLLWTYVAFLAPFPSSIATVTGSGLISPSF